MVFRSGIARIAFERDTEAMYQNSVSDEGGLSQGRKFGVYVHLSKEELLGQQHVDSIRQLIVEHGVICFPSVYLSNDEQRCFALGFGREILEWDVAADNSAYNDKVLAEYQKASLYWHYDGFGVPVPEFAAIMSPRGLGDNDSAATEFADCRAAYQDLPWYKKQQMDSLEVEHRFETLMRHVNPNPSPEELGLWQKDSPPRCHPLVWHHATEGNSILLGCSAFSIRNMEEVAGRALIDELNAWIAQPKYIFRYHWQVGDLVIWNNSAVLHRAAPHSGSSDRKMRRTSIFGIDPPR